MSSWALSTAINRNSCTVMDANAAGSSFTTLNLRGSECNIKPFEPTPTFTGREGVLDQLSKYFDQPMPSAKRRQQNVVVLWGLGGTGKTQIALKFVSDYHERYVGYQIFSVHLYL